MDDPTRTREALEALANLYLSEGVRGAAPKAEKPTWKIPTGASGGGALEGSAALQPTTSAGVSGSQRRVRGSGAWAARFAEPGRPGAGLTGSLGGSRKPREGNERNGGVLGRVSGVARAGVEAVFLGNLPGISGPWLNQYAFGLAEKHGGPVAVVSVDGEEVDLEVVAGDERELDGLEEGVLESYDGRSMADVVERLWGSGRVAVWLIHLPTPVDAVARARALEVGRWTVLCGADDAAVVGAYRLFKQLAGGDAADGKSQERQREIGVMVFGSDEAAGRGAAIKLNHAAGRFLSTPVEVRGWQKQMRPIHVRSIGYFVHEAGDPWAELTATLLRADGSRWDDRGAVPEQLVVSGPAATAGVREETDGGQAVGQGVGSGSERSGSVKGGGAGAWDAKVEEGGQELLGVEWPVCLSGFIAESEGGVRLDARCPRSPGAELMVDRGGRVHVMMGCPSGVVAGGEVKGSGWSSVFAGVMGLLEAGEWVREHRGLLRLTRLGEGIDLEAEPTLHLFTDRAGVAVKWARCLPRLVRLHFLYLVGGEPSAQWRCEEVCV